MSDAICAPAAIGEPGLDHAAEHHAEPERAGGVRHPHRLADPARLRELDVDPVRALGARGDVGERVAVLVDEDRHGRAPLQLGAARVAGRQRLLAVVDLHLRADSRAPRRASSTRSRRPGAGRSVAARTARTRSTSSPSPPAELELQPLEARRGRARRGAPCRPGRRARPSTTSAGLRAGARAAATPAGPASFPQRSCSAASSALRAANSPPGSRSKISSSANGSSPSSVRVLLHVCARRLGRLPVALDRRRLAEAADVAVPSSSWQSSTSSVELAGDHERLRERHRDDPGADLHRRNPSPAG